MPGNANSSPQCGRKAVISYNGKTATGTLVDKCPGCVSPPLLHSPLDRVLITEEGIILMWKLCRVEPVLTCRTIYSSSSAMKVLDVSRFHGSSRLNWRNIEMPLILRGHEDNSQPSFTSCWGFWHPRSSSCHLFTLAGRIFQKKSPDKFKLVQIFLSIDSYFQTRMMTQFPPLWLDEYKILGGAGRGPGGLDQKGGLGFFLLTSFLRTKRDFALKVLWTYIFFLRPTTLDDRWALTHT